LASGPGRPQGRQRWWAGGGGRPSSFSYAAGPLAAATLSSSPTAAAATDGTDAPFGDITSAADPLTPSAGKAKRTRDRRKQQLAKELAEIEAAQAQGGKAGADLYLNALRSCAKAGEVATAMRLLRAFPPPAARVAYNLVLEAAAQAGDARTALGLYEEMVAEGGIGANVFTFGQLLALHAKRGDGEAALALLAEMDRRAVAGNAFTYTSAIDACERAGFPAETTESLLREMAEREVAPTVVTYNAIIARRAERPDTWQEALDWLKRLETSGLRPLRSSYAAALNACERAEDWPLVVELVERAAAQGVADAALWSRYLAALLRLERYEEVPATVRRLQAQAAKAKAKEKEKEKPGKDKAMVAAASAPDEVMYTLALKACALGHRPFPEARALLEEMREAGLAPNVVTFSAAMEACKAVRACMRACVRACMCRLGGAGGDGRGLLGSEGKVIALISLHSHHYFYAFADHHRTGTGRWAWSCCARCRRRACGPTRSRTPPSSTS
jgi:pentatricopeptide repeat protein